MEQLTTANPEIPINDWAAYIPWRQAQQEWLSRLWDKWLMNKPCYVRNELRDGPSSHGRQGMDRMFDKWLKEHEDARPNPGDLVRIEGEDDLFRVQARDLGVIGVIVSRLTSEGGERCIVEKYLHKVSPEEEVVMRQRIAEREAARALERAKYAKDAKAKKRKKQRQQLKLLKG